MTETAADRSSASAHSSPPSTRSRPWTYAARPDSEAALHGLVARLRSGETRIALEGPPASGKTLLLHVLPERLGSAFATAYIPHPGLDPAGVRAWLESFGEPLPADAGSTFEDLAFAYARRGAGLVLLKTATTQQVDWLDTGRAYARVHLGLTQLGLTCHPYNQVLQEYPEMTALQREFDDLVGVQEPQKIQKAVRVGRAAKRAYVAPRRDPGDFIVDGPAAAA